MKYKVDDIVDFTINGEMRRGIIFVADRWTFESDTPSYDIFVEEENMLYKHVGENLVSLAN